MLIILEGPDGTGKTSLAQRLAVQLAVKYPRDRVEVLHRGVPSPTSHPLDEYVLPLLDYGPNEGRHIVCDRWHWGEYVYPRALKRESRMDDAVFRYVELFLQSRGAVIYWPFTRVDELSQRLITLNKDQHILPDLPELQYFYHEVSERSRLHQLLRQSDTTPDRLINAGHFNEVLHSQLNPFVTLVGDRNPHALLIGDVRHAYRNGHIDLDDHRPAFMPYQATSGHYLLGADIPCTYALANACDVDNIFELIKQARPRRIVALGSKAHRALTASNIPHGAVPHPQYVRRFHPRARQQYYDLLVDTIETEEDHHTWRPSSTATTDVRSTPASSSTSLSTVRRGPRVRG